MRLSRSLALALTLALSGGSAGAAGRTRGPSKANLEEAQSRYQRARELYEENDYQAALVEFQRAYELAPSYRLLYNIAQVQYQLQDYAGALGSFQRYLEEGGGELPAQRRDEVQREVDRLQARVATVRITVNKPGAEISVDDVPVGTSPMRTPLQLNAGRRKISASLPGVTPVTRVVDVAGRDSLDVSLEFAAPSAPAPVASVAPAPSSRPEAPRSAVAAPPEVVKSQRSTPLVPWIATGGLAVATGVTAVLALNASGDLKTQRDTFGVSRAQLDQASGRTRTLALTTDVLAGATLVAAGVSTWLTFLREPEPASSADVQVGVGPGGVGVAGSF
ncbi:PEGA domain-containing protein [Archangium violaceum]|uniref:tetratricopeptide repeat protein n=1 Tax=Archangium violaceum TaxID=83451 RepID=UPI00194F76D0|nr:tetratricopeptide repeat protein [Archangium violaceum]QRN99840.1 PEGA domain-containing protein [Archangium violaceum]